MLHKAVGASALSTDARGGATSNELTEKGGEPQAGHPQSKGFLARCPELFPGNAHSRAEVNTKDKINKTCGAKNTSPQGGATPASTTAAVAMDTGSSQQRAGDCVETGEGEGTDTAEEMEMHRPKAEGEAETERRTDTEAETGEGGRGRGRGRYGERE